MKFLTIFLLFFLFTEQAQSSVKILKKGIMKYSPFVQSSQSRPQSLFGKTFQDVSVNGALISGSTLLAAKAFLVRKFLIPSKKKLIKKLITMNKPVGKPFPSISYADPSEITSFDEKVNTIGKKFVTMKLPKAKISPIFIAKIKPKIVKTKPVKPKIILPKVKPIIIRPKLVIKPQLIKPKIVKPKFVKPILKKEIQKIPVFVAAKPKLVVTMPKIIPKSFVHKKIG